MKKPFDFSVGSNQRLSSYDMVKYALHIEADQKEHDMPSPAPNERFIIREIEAEADFLWPERIYLSLHLGVQDKHTFCMGYAAIPSGENRRTIVFHEPFGIESLVLWRCYLTDIPEYNLIIRGAIIRTLP